MIRKSRMYAAPTNRAVARTGTRRDRRRILVVEDDRDLAELISRALGVTYPNTEVDVAETAGRARYLVSTQSYQFALVDYFLDDGELGTDLVPQIRKAQPKMGVAMMSSLELMRFVEVTSALQGIQILPKPFSNRQLTAFFHEVLNDDPAGVSHHVF